MIVTVTGMRHYDARKPKYDEPVVLVRNPENEHDNKAVAAFNRHGQLIGYIQKKYNQNETVFSLIRDGMLIGVVYLTGKTYLVIELDDPQ